MLISTHEVEIEFGDCDPAGIVFYPNHFRMFDAATAPTFGEVIAAFRSLGQQVE